MTWGSWQRQWLQLSMSLQTQHANLCHRRHKMGNHIMLSRMKPKDNLVFEHLDQLISM